MNQTLPTCAQCSTSFWPNGRLNPDVSQHFCDNCVPEGKEVALSSDPSTDGFQGYQARPAMARPSIEVIRSAPRQPTAEPRLSIQPRQLPGEVKTPTPTPSLPQTLAFNCPACIAVLNISRELAIAGTTAPCPHCASMVVPPRIAPAVATRQPVQKANWRPDY